MRPQKRLNRERETVSKMIAIYCRAHHHTNRGSLCQGCLSLEAYAFKRIKFCPFGWHKPTCGRCPVHCYKPDWREDIRRVMRYAGPRMLFRHPILALCHLIDERRKQPAG